MSVCVYTLPAQDSQNSSLNDQNSSSGTGVGLPRVTPDATVSALQRDVNVPWCVLVTQSPPCPMVMLMQLLIPAKASSPHKEIRQHSLPPCWVLVNISLPMYY